MSHCRECEHLPLDQRLEEDIGQGDDFPQAGTAVEEVHARRGHDALVEIRTAAVVPDVIAAQVQLRNPENLGPCELRLGHPDAGLGGGHDQGPGVGESQGGGQVDRKPQVVRRQGAGLSIRVRSCSIATGAAAAGKRDSLGSCTARGTGTALRSNHATGGGHSLGSRIGRRAASGTPSAALRGAVASPVTRNAHCSARRGRGIGAAATSELLGRKGAGKG